MSLWKVSSCWASWRPLRDVKYISCFFSYFFICFWFTLLVPLFKTIVRIKVALGEAWAFTKCPVISPHLGLSVFILLLSVCLSDWQACWQADKETEGQTDRQTDTQAHRHTGTQAHKQTGRQTDRQTDRQAGRQSGRQADRQAGRQADSQTDRPTGT